MHLLSQAPRPAVLAFLSFGRLRLDQGELVCDTIQDWATKSTQAPADGESRQPTVLTRRRAGPWFAQTRGMSALAFKVTKKDGAYVKPSLVPADHSGKRGFGALDGAILAFFLLCVAGLVCLLLMKYH